MPQVYSLGACCRIQAYAQQKQQRQDEHEAQKAAKQEVADRCSPSLAIPVLSHGHACIHFCKLNKCFQACPTCEPSNKVWHAGPMRR